MKKLFILYGGPGREREVSISSGRNVMQALDEQEIDYEHILVNQDGGWVYKERTLSQTEGIDLLLSHNALVFQVIHGTFGEDGYLTAFFEENNISFVGSSSEAMRLTIDKFKTEKKLQESGILTTTSALVDNVADIPNVKVDFPVFVKPKDEGSSISLFKVKDEEELREALLKSIPVYGAMLVQPFIAGRELTCGVVEIEGETKALIPTEVVLTKGETFDYEAKYTVGGSKEITPAEIDTETTKRVQELALNVHTVCGCKDISRTDMILKENGELVVLEINTIPGMTKTSFIPAQLEASGYSVVLFVQGMLEKYSK
jgi:D-alanine-D-alanine ligase